MTREELMLEYLTFDLMVESPFPCLFALLGQLGIVHNKRLRDSAWAMCNDACLTMIPLIMNERDVAISAIFFASAHTKQPIDDVNGEPWWKFLKGNEDKCAQAIEAMYQFYTENPLKKQNPAMQSPIFHLDSTRRRGDTLMSQTETMSSAAPTPLDLERGTQSPRTRTNGGVDRDDVPKEAGSKGTFVGDDLQGQQRSGNGTPAKRKDIDEDVDSDGGRAPKKTRHSVSDEGQIGEA
jgi:protein BUR2